MHKIGVAAMAAVVLGACATAPGPSETTHEHPEPPISRPDATASDVGMPDVPPPVGTEEDFGVLASLVGTRWRGVPLAGEGEAGGFVDVTEWYWDLGGTVLANRHALGDGSYGGLTYVQKTAETGDLDYVYVTSAGFRTMGQYTLNDDGSWGAFEEIEGLGDFLAVRTRGEFNTQERSFQVVSEYETLSGWVPGQTLVYSPYDGPMPDLKPVVE